MPLPEASRFIDHFVGALPCPAIAHVRFEHVEKVVNVVEQPAAQHVGEVIVQHCGVIAKLLRYSRDVLAIFSELAMMRALTETSMASYAV